MIDEKTAQYLELLRGLYIFQGLDEGQLAYILTRFRAVIYRAGQTIFQEGDVDNYFYVIYGGKVRLSRLQRNVERQIATLGSGDYFGEGALLFQRPRSATATAVETCELLQLDQEEFLEILQEFPQMRMNLSATAESRYLAQKEKFDWLGPDEVIYLITRKHNFFLLLSIIPPILWGVVSIPLIVYSLTNPPQFLSTAAMAIGIFGVLLSILWGVWNWVDWGNDFYIVTNQRVVWLERVIALYYSRREAPLTTILAVNVTSSQVGRILNYGNIHVKTFTGGIFIRNAANPGLFEGYVKSHQMRAQRKQRQLELAQMRRALRRKLGQPVEEEPLKPALQPPPAPTRPGVIQPLDSFRQILNTFLKVRFEQGSTITYRKHWLVLLGKSWKPTLVLIGLTAGVLYMLYRNWFQTSSVFSGAVWLMLLSMSYLAILVWWVYHYVDWSNDVYQLTPDQILDIERKPLGKEDKKTASLDSILSLEHSRTGIIQLLFNFGEVIINVGQTRFDFRGVYNPDQVHQDIADYMEARLRKKRAAEEAREREKMVEWLATYHAERPDFPIQDLESEAFWDLFPG